MNLTSQSNRTFENTVSKLKEAEYRLEDTETSAKGTTAYIAGKALKKEARKDARTTLPEGFKPGEYWNCYSTEYKHNKYPKLNQEGQRADLPSITSTVTSSTANIATFASNSTEQDWPSRVYSTNLLSI